MTNQPLNNNMMKTTQNINRSNRNQLEPIHSTSLLTASAAVFLKTSKQFLTVAVGAGVVLASAVAVQAVTIEMVTVGDAGNANDTINRSGSSWDTTSLGAVAYEYQIGKYEVTCEQYVEFLNAAAKSDPYGLYRTEMGTVLGKSPGITRSGSSPNYTYTLFTHAGDGGVPGSVWAPKPVGWMSKWDGVRFCNWLHNGQPSDGTGLQDGSYTLTGSGKVPDNAATVTRNAGATWVLPNDNEWHKAAYYKGLGGGYWDYPTQSNAQPQQFHVWSTTGVGTPPGSNYGNFSVDAGGWGPLTPMWYRTAEKEYHDPLSVGTSGGPSYYGAYDMAGNAAEYIDIPPVGSPLEYLERGGYMHGNSSVSHVDQYQTDSRDGYSYDGFRVVNLGTPTAAVASTDWNLTTTWDTQKVPDQATPVTVNTYAVTIDSAQSTTPAICNSLTIMGTGGSVTATGQSLTVGGDLNTTSGALTLNGTSTLNIAKANTSASLKGLTVGLGTILNITGELTVDASKDLTGATLNTPKVTLTGGSTLTVGALNTPKVILAGGSTLTVGALNVPGAGYLTGTGTVAGAVAVASGGKVSPGSDTTIATIATNSLSLASDSLLTINAASTSSNDQITVGTSGGLTINGGAITFLNADGTGPVTEFGTYQLIGYSGAIVGSVSSLTVANKALYTDYTFGTASNFVTLTVSQGALPVPFLSQNFDDDPVNYTNSPFVVGATDKNDYWALSNTGDGMLLNTNFTDASGTYLTGQDMDAGGGLAFTTGAPAFIDFTVPATGYVDLRLSIALAGAPKAENINYVRAKLDNDGDGTYETTLFNFVGNSNSAYTDTVLGALSTAFKTFTYIALPTPTASDGNLRLRLEVFCDTNNLGVDSENIGIDNIVIAGMPVSGYTSWAATNAGGQEASQDSNNDGVANGVAYFMNATGLATNPAINGTTKKVTWPNGGKIPSDQYGIQFVVQTSSDLQTWADVPATGDPNLINTNYSAGPPAVDGELSYTLTGTSPRFVRLKVTPN